jgi:hypothetical protein
VPGLWLIVACSGDAAQFAEDRVAAVCARHDRCDTLEAAGFADEAECQTALLHAAEEEGSACPGFDASAAEACLAAWDVECTETPDLDVCEQVCGR